MAEGDIRELVLHPDLLLDEAELRAEVARQCGRRLDTVFAVEILRKAIDARRGKVRLRCLVQLRGPGDPPQAKPIMPRDPPTLSGPARVAIVGAGPAGLFCAWGLAQAGIASVILERGKAVRERRRDLAALSQRGELDPESNYCFGEGGAGTFSDGKLYTRAQKRGPVKLVLETLVGYGASPDILVDARPHIGTNRLPKVITTMREHLQAAGVSFLFGHKVRAVSQQGAAMVLDCENGQRIAVDKVVLAPGHSARDVFSWAQQAGAQLVSKPFAMGVRIEHPQADVDRIQYGELAGHPALGAANYRLVEQACGKGVFSFCMCPGGYIVPAATEPGGQVVNGWSPSSRRGKFANSGFVVEVGPDDLAAAGLDPGDPFSGVNWQRRLERQAYAAGGGAFVAPAQRLVDLVAGRPSEQLPECSYPRGIRSARVDELLGRLRDPIVAALLHIAKRMPGFLSEHAVALALESRTSCPLRMLRDETLQALGLAGLYPCGEGAGHAGGIVSAALDGLKVADAIAKTMKLQPPLETR